jgi:hypothetical protein
MSSTIRRTLALIAVVIIAVAIVALIVSKFREATFYPG